MDITLNIEDYLSKEEIQEECKFAIRQRVREHFQKTEDLERLISNLSYEFIFKAVDETTGINSVQKIKDTVTELIQKRHTIDYALFKPADAWGRSEAVGLKILHEAINENIPLIKEKVKEAITNYNFLDRKDLQTRMEDVFHEMLEEKIFGNTVGEQS